MEPLMTKKDLAKHWQKSERAINDYVAQGIITPCKGVPGDMRFDPAYIRKLDGVELDKFSPLERRRLEREIEELEIRNNQLKDMLNQKDAILAKMTAIGIEAMHAEVKDA